MTPADLDAILVTYAAGLDVELDLLRRLHALAADQKQKLAAGSIGDLGGSVEERDRVMAALLSIEAQLGAVRELLATHLDMARSRPDFASVASLHRVAANLVSDILGNDRETLAAVREGAAARRSLARMLETGGTTLAAYRRIIAPPPPHASLFDERG